MYLPLIVRIVSFRWRIMHASYTIYNCINIGGLTKTIIRRNKILCTNVNQSVVPELLHLHVQWTDSVADGLQYDLNHHARAPRTQWSVPHQPNESRRLCRMQNKRTNKQVKGIRLDQSGTTRNSKYKNEDCGGKFWVAACGQALETEISWIGWFASDNYASTRPVSSQTKHSTVNSMVLCNLTVWLFQGSDC